MKHSLFAATAATALILAACGDDSSSASASYSQSGSLYVDEAQQLLVITTDPFSIDQCVVTQAGLAWKSVSQPGDVDSAKYSFLGDTLVLLDIDEGETDNYGDLFVGGSAGNIYGTWTYLPCSYNSRTGEKECYEKEARYMTRTLKLSQGKATADIEYHFDVYLSDIEAVGYMKSYFMKELYNALNGGYYFDGDANDIFDVYEDEDYETLTRSIEKNNVQIIEETKTSQTFKIGEKTYTVTINKADQSFKFNYNAYTDEDISIDVTDGVKTCNVYTIRKVVDNSLCKEENLEHLKINNDPDEEFAYATYYRINNDVEFEECIKSIAVAQNNNTYGDDALYKKADDKKEAFKKRSEKQLRKMMKFIEK
ncbi:MAG: hypothetical protein IK114_02095 [Fibrobacter sp.]|nr:hypothetical protein [Fibrobacter sp.]